MQPSPALALSAHFRGGGFWKRQQRQAGASQEHRSPSPTNTPYDGQRQMVCPGWFSGSINQLTGSAGKCRWAETGGKVRGWSESGQEERREDGDPFLFLWEDEKGFQNQSLVYRRMSPSAHPPQSGQASGVAEAPLHRPWAFDSSEPRGAECHPPMANLCPEARPSQPGPQLSWNLPQPDTACTPRGPVTSCAVWPHCGENRPGGMLWLVAV